MPQAMDRLLASPKTTAVLPARLIMLSLFLHGRREWLPDRAISRISATAGFLGLVLLDVPAFFHEKQGLHFRPECIAQFGMAEGFLDPR
jgi:hypothetical protein